MKRSALAIALIAALSGCGDESGGPNKNHSSNSNTVKKSGSIKIEDASVKEGNSDIQNTKIRITRSGGKDGVIKGKFTTYSGTALPNEDYLETSGDFEFQDGVTRIDITIPIIGDLKDEDDEFFLVKIHDVIGADNIDKDSAKVVIINDDTPPILSFTSDFRVTSEGSGRIDIPVRLSAPSGKTVSVNYFFSGLATEGEDYIVLSENPVTFQPGITEKNITLNIIDDEIPEGGETIKINLNKESNAILKKDTNTTIVILGNLILNDTGVTTYLNGNDFGSQQPSNDLPGQDADFGADTGSRNYLDGYAGFSFTKLDSSGNHLPHTATTWSCVLDNKTGIVWENKADEITDIPSSLSEAEFKNLINDAWSASRNPNSKDYAPYPYDHWHENWQARNYLYTWFSKEKNNDGGSPGSIALDFPNRNAPVNGKSQCAFPTSDSSSYVKVSSCSTNEYIRVANQLGLCGYKDWRLPSIEEIRSIINYEYTEPLLDKIYFDDFKSGEPIWSSTPSATGEGTAWCMDSNNGQAKLCHKQSNSASIRLARGGKQ